MVSTLNATTLRLDCPLCGEQPASPLFAQPGAFQVYFCPVCKLGQTWPYPSESNGQEYFTDSDEHFARQYATNREKWRGYMASILNHARPHVTGGSMLDVGTGIGFMLELAQERGFTATGIDPSPAAVRYAREKLHLNVVQGHFPAPELDGCHFDLITLSHVLEHVPDPLEFLTAVKASLKPGGVAVITAPSYRGLIGRVIGRRWYGFQPDQHIWQLNPRTVAQLFQKAGLTVLKASSESMDYSGTSWKSLIYRTLATSGAFVRMGDQLIVITQNSTNGTNDLK